MSSTIVEDATPSSSASSSSGGEDRVEERFRVDRRKLESLMAPLAEEMAPRHLEQFFAEIERQTGAQVAWPSRLKIGAKSKRDPQVKVSGSPAAVQLAKALILSHCSRKFSKLTMRIDVSHAEHGQLIGRHGALQKEIKSRTGTDIHFPDSNKSATAAAAGDHLAKSNQVSLNGLSGPQPVGMEAARRVIRAKQPVALLIQLPAAPALPDPASHAFVRQVCATFDVSAGRQLDDDAHGVCWTVRGLAENSEGLARAVESLAFYLANLLMLQAAAASPTLLVRCRLDFERRHAAAVRDRMQAELLGRATPAGDAKNFFKAALKQFGVRQFDFTDTGVVMWEAGGCRALLRLRQFVIACLPAYLCFDMPCNSFAFEDSAIESLKGRTVDDVSVDFAVRRANGNSGSGGGGGGGGGARAVTLRTHEGNAHAMFRLLGRLFATPVPDAPSPTTPPPPPPTAPLVTLLSVSPSLMPPQFPASPPLALSQALPQPPPPPPQEPSPPPPEPPVPVGQPQRQLSSDSLAPGAEYSRKRLEALRIMSHRPSGDRFPTGQWSGLYFSRSWTTSETAGAPASQQAGQQPSPSPPRHHHPPAVSEASAADAVFAQSCYHQQLQLPLSPRAADPPQASSADALLRLLGDNNLTDCAQAMLSNEIDLQTFRTLSDEDLKALGLCFATREKIHRLIHSMAAGPLV